MKKFFIIFLLIILPALSFSLGFFIKKYIDDKKIEQLLSEKNEIQKFNDECQQNNKSLNKLNIELNNKLLNNKSNLNKEQIEKSNIILDIENAKKFV